MNARNRDEGVAAQEGSVINPVELEDSYAVSPLQEGMLFHSLYAPRSQMYIRQIVVDLRENLNIEILKRSWERVIERHPILRASLRWEDVSEPVQQVHRRVNLPFELLDWRDCSLQDQESQLEDYRKSDRSRGFD